MRVGKLQSEAIEQQQSKEQVENQRLKDKMGRTTEK